MRASVSSERKRPCPGLPCQASETLASIEIFRHLPPEAVRMLSRRCRWRRHAAHRTVVHCQGTDRDVFFVVRGRVCAIYHSACGRDVRFRDLPAGETFGDFAAIDGEPRSADVIALSDTLTASMTAETFWEVLRQYESVAAATLCRLTRIARTMLRRVVEFSTLPVRERIHVELLRLGRVTAPGPGPSTAIIAPAPTHTAMASRISTHREAVTRELSELARVGLIEKRDGTLIIRDVAALAENVRHALEDPCWESSLADAAATVSGEWRMVSSSE